MLITFRHSQSGVTKQTKLGFSWTTLLFGLFVPLLRGDLKWTIIMLILAFLTFGISWLIFPFVYNKVYIKSMLESGYTPVDENAKNVLQNRGFQFAS
ncbi:MAG: HrgC protein [bacterium]|nr:HrgC protein [bacterium]